ncbi:hypothetical protein D3C81_1466410 [compost metagenome]
MRVLKGEIYYTIGEVAKLIKRKPQTIKGWYAWQEEGHEADLPDLPEVFTNFDTKGTRYFKASDVKQLEAFRDSITHGVMAEFNRQRWGVRGKEIKNKKDEPST